MEIGRVDKKVAREKGLCYKCGKTGHISRNCPGTKGKGKADPPKKDDRRRYIHELYMEMTAAEQSEMIQDFLQA